MAVIIKKLQLKKRIFASDQQNFSWLLGLLKQFGEYVVSFAFNKTIKWPFVPNWTDSGDEKHHKT